MSVAKHRRELLVFGREPRAGETKTRLIPALGADGAARLYEAMLRRTLVTGSQVSVDRRSLWLDAWLPNSEVRADAEHRGFAVRHQSGTSLGERMTHALGEALNACGSAVLIGSDCPDFSTGYLEQAFAVLERHDAVLGPAADGGYVLIGMKQVAGAVFERVDWGSAAVLEQTRGRLRDLRWRWAELPTLHDIDEPGDLGRLPDALKGLVESC